MISGMILNVKFCSLWGVVSDKNKFKDIYAHLETVLGKKIFMRLVKNIVEKVIC